MASIYSIPLQTIDGQASSLEQYKGKVLLVVNVRLQNSLISASVPGSCCLKSLAGKPSTSRPSERFSSYSFSSPSYCGVSPHLEVTYNVQFPLFSKISVVGEDRHPLYRELEQAQPVAVDGEARRERLASRGLEASPAPQVLWNFEKFLIARDGTVVGRFAPDVVPDDPRLREAIAAELAK